MAAVDRDSYHAAVPESAGELMFAFVTQLDAMTAKGNAARYKLFQQLPTILAQFKAVYGERKGHTMFVELLSEHTGRSKSIISRWLAYACAPYVDGMEYMSQHEILSALAIERFTAQQGDPVPFEVALDMIRVVGVTEARREYGLSAEHHEWCACPRCGSRHRQKGGQR